MSFALHISHASSHVCNVIAPVRLPFLYDFGFVVAEIIGAKKVVTYKAKEMMAALKSGKGRKAI